MKIRLMNSLQEDAPWAAQQLTTQGSLGFDISAPRTYPPWPPSARRLLCQGTFNPELLIKCSSPQNSIAANTHPEWKLKKINPSLPKSYRIWTILWYLLSLEMMAFSGDFIPNIGSFPTHFIPWESSNLTHWTELHIPGISKSLSKKHLIPENFPTLSPLLQKWLPRRSPSQKSQVKSKVSSLIIPWKLLSNKTNSNEAHLVYGRWLWLHSVEK